MAATVVDLAGALDPARPLERAYELRDGRAGDARAAGEVGGGDRFRCDGSQAWNWRERQRWLVRGEQALDPAADMRGDADQGIHGVGATGPRHS